MSALRKAGVWLGLVEEEDEPYELEDEFGEEDDFAPSARPRSLARSTDREPRSDYRRGRLGLGSDRETGSRESAARDPHARREPASRADGRADGRADSRRLTESRAPEPRMPESRLPESRVPEARAEREPWGSERLSRTGETLREPYAERDSARGRDDARERDGSVRQLSRTTPVPASPVSYPTHDNLALAPQVQLRERAVVSEEKTRRYQITTLHPTSYAEARTIGEHFRDGYPVIMNLTEMDEPDAKRLVDFAAGLAFGTRGSMERVTNRVFLLSPPNIEVSAEDKAKIAESGFFDQG
jgi:cell division inhibitor SepF